MTVKLELEGSSSQIVFWSGSNGRVPQASRLRSSGSACCIGIGCCSGIFVAGVESSGSILLDNRISLNGSRGWWEVMSLGVWLCELSTCTSDDKLWAWGCNAVSHLVYSVGHTLLIQSVWLFVSVVECVSGSCTVEDGGVKWNLSLCTTWWRRTNMSRTLVCDSVWVEVLGGFSADFSESTPLLDQDIVYGR